MSEVKVNKISPRSGTDVTLGDSGDTFTVPAGASIVNNGTSTGFGPTGAVSWNTTPITADPSPAVSGVGYFADTTSAAFTITLPAAPSAGAVVGVCDYAGTFATNNITLDANGLNIEGAADDKLLTTNREGVIITYVDATQGWVATSGVNSGDQALDPSIFTAELLIVAGGGGGGGGGAGAGGLLSGSETLSVLNSYTVTVGGGGSGGVLSSSPGTQGSNSLISGTGISTFTANGGAGGAADNSNGNSGGSGGGGGASSSGNKTAGAATQGSISPLTGFGNASGTVPGSSNPYPAAGGGGAGAVGGTPSVNASTSGAGGAGTANSITGSSVTYAGGGGGGKSSTTTGGAGGIGGGGSGDTASNGTANTGGGGGGAAAAGAAGDGGSGIVIIKYPDAFTISNPGGGLTSSTATAGGFSVTSFTAGTGTIEFN